MNEWVDIRLDKKRWELVTAASETLDSCMMARFDKRSGNLGVTDLGRIASHYYIKHGMQLHTIHTELILSSLWHFKKCCQLLSRYETINGYLRLFSRVIVKFFLAR